MISSTLDDVRQIAADVLQIPLQQIAPDSSPATISGWDSVQHLSLVLAVEERFRVQFGPEDFDEMKSVRQIAELVARKLA